MNDDAVADSLAIIQERRPSGDLAELPAPAYVAAERPFEDGTRGGGGSVIFLPEVNGYTASGTALDSVTTKGAQVGVLYIFKHATDNLCFFKLREGDDAEDVPSIVRPADFDATDNAVVFENVLESFNVFQGVNGIVHRVQTPGVIKD